MPTATITSAKSGQTFDVDFNSVPTPEDIDEATSAWDTQFYQREGLDPTISEQGPVGTVVNQVRNVGPGLVGGLLAQGGRVLDASSKLVEQGLVGVFGANDFTRSGGGFQDVANVGDRLIEAGQELRPTNPANPIANTVGSGVQQAAGLVATMGLAAPFMGTKAALTTVPVVTGAIMGGGEGVQTARDLGITSPAGQLATGAAFAGAEILTERLGGIGNKAATEALQAGLKAGLKQAGKTALGEAIEEPLAGTAQDLTTRVAGEFVADPNRPGYTVTGMKLPALDAEFLQRRKLEAIGGLAGGAVFGGLQLAANGNMAPAPAPMAKPTEAPVSESLGDLTAEDVADLEQPTVNDSLTVQPRSPLQPILTNVPDAVQGVRQVISDPNPVPVVGQPVPAPAEVPSAVLPGSMPIADQTGEQGIGADLSPATDASATQPTQATQESQPVVPELLTPEQLQSYGQAQDVADAQARLVAAMQANDRGGAELAMMSLSGAKAGSGPLANRARRAQDEAVTLAVLSGRPVHSAALERWAQYSDTNKMGADGNIERRGIPAGYQKQGDVYAIEPAERTGFKNLNVSGNTAGFVNGDILAEAEALIRQGFTDFANWSRAMVTRFGAAIREYLQGIWGQVSAALPNDAAKNVRLGRPGLDAPVGLSESGAVDIFNGQVRGMSTSAIEVLHKDSTELPKPKDKVSNDTVAKNLQEAALRQWGDIITSDNITPEQEAILVANGVFEFVAAFRASGKTAADWYTTNIESAMAVANVIHEELKSDQAAQAVRVNGQQIFRNKEDAQLALYLAMAITSQNLNVNQNTTYAEEQFQIFKATGKFDSSRLYGEKAKSISANLDLANTVLAKLGWENLDQIIKETYTVRELSEFLAEITGKNLKIAGRMDDEVQGAAIFGPKIGQGFLQNLMGNYLPVTIDLWMRRTWGRWTGDVLGDGLTGERIARLIDEARTIGLPMPAILSRLRPVVRVTDKKKSFRTMSEDFMDRIEAEEDLRKQLNDYAKEVVAIWTRKYNAVQSGITEAQRDGLLEGTLSMDDVAKTTLRNEEQLNRQWEAKNNKPKGAGAKETWKDTMRTKSGRTYKLTTDQWNGTVNGVKNVGPKLKPQWALAANVIRTQLKPIDAPSDQDRAVISRIVNKIRVELDNQGISVSNADIQAVLWYPEKDLWAKLRGEEESNLKQSYEDEFIKLARERGFGAEAEAAAARVRATRTGGSTDQGSDGRLRNETVSLGETQGGFKNTVIERDLEGGFLTTAGVDALFDLANAAITAGKTFVQWSGEMVSRFGEAVRSALQTVWNGAQKLMATDAAKNVRLGLAAKTSPVRLAQGGFIMGPGKVKETQSRFARANEQERLYEVREDVTVKAAAESWVNSMPMADAVAAMEAGRLPASMTGDVAQHAAGLLIQRTTEMMKSGSEVVQMQARSLGHRISKVWQGWLSQEAGRNLRQRSVVNSELSPYAPILAAEGMLIDRADAVMDGRFEGGAEGASTKVNEVAEDAGDEAGESLADDLAGDTPEQKTAKKRVRKQMAPAKKKLSKAQRTAERILQQLSEVFADPPIWKQKGQPDPVRALYMQHVRQPMAQADFVRQAMALGVPQGLAGTLWQASQMEIEARETLRMMADAERAAARDARQVEVAENRASRLIYRTEERLRQGSKDLSRSTDGDSINRVFRDKVKDDIDWESFRDRLAKLRVGEEIAARLWRTAGRERIDQEAMVRFRADQKAGEIKQGILAAGSQKLRQMLNELRKKIAPDMTWADVFMELPASQKERQREIYRRLMLDERLNGLTKDERLALTNELDKAWQQERRKVFLRELERAGVMGEKSITDKTRVVRALPKLIRLINLGMMNSDMFREAIAPEYGLKQITPGQALSLRKMAEQAYDLPEGVLRSRKLAELLDGIQKSTGTSRAEVLNQYWVAAVLSGLRTQFDTFMSLANGFGNQFIQSGMLALKSGNRAAATVSMLEWWRGLAQAFPEAMQIVSKGDYSYLKRFNDDLKKALEGESTFRPVPLGEALWRDGNAMEKYGFAPVMIFVGRLMAAADHLNNSATTAGAKVVARALHPELYKTVAPNQAKRDAAAAQALREVTGGAMPATAQERATVSARTREILNGQMRPEEVKEASFMGDQAAYQNDPTGVFGAIYGAVNQGMGSLERGLQAYADSQGTDGPAGQYARGLLLFLSGAMRSMMGAKFIRFGANFGNDMLGYVPGTALISPAVLGTDATRSQKQLLLGKNVFGLMAGLTVAAMFLGKDDEEDGWHLEGPYTDLTPEEIKQRRAAGFEPLTLWKRSNDKISRVSYKQWPTAGLLAGVGHMQDRQRFRPEKWAKEGMAGHLLAAASVGAFQVKEVSAMRGLADLLGSSKLGANPEEALVDKLMKMPISFAGGFIPSLTKDLDALSDPQRYKPTSVLEEFLRNVPVARRAVAGGRPEINILGLPIEQDRKPWSRAYTEAENSLAHERLAKLTGRGFTLPTPETNRKVWKGGAWTTIAALGTEAEWRYQKRVGDGYRQWLGSPEAATLLTNPDGLAVQRLINRQADTIKTQAAAELAK